MCYQLYEIAPERDFQFFNPQTKYLILAILKRATESEKVQGLKSNEKYHLDCLAKNLSQSPSLVEAAGHLLDNQRLKWGWQDILPVILADCLYPFHAESYFHSVRVSEIVSFLFQKSKGGDFRYLPDYGNREFAQIQQTLILDEEDWIYVLYAAYHHDLGKLAYEEKFWDTAGKFTKLQREYRKSHPGMFFPIGEMFAVPLKVTALALAHHYLNLGYPDNGLIKCFQDIIFEPKFKQILAILTTLDCYDGMRGPRSYHREKFSHQKVMEYLGGELGQMGTCFTPLVECVNASPICADLYPN